MPARLQPAPYPKVRLVVASKIRCKWDDGRRFPFKTAKSSKEGPGPGQPAADHLRRGARPDRLPAVPRRAPPPHPPFQLHRARLRRNPPQSQGHRPPPWPDQLPRPGLGRARPCRPRLARVHHDRWRPAAAPVPAPLAARSTRPATAACR